MIDFHELKLKVHKYWRYHLTDQKKFVWVWEYDFAEKYYYYTEMMNHYPILHLELLKFETFLFWSKKMRSQPKFLPDHDFHRLMRIFQTTDDRVLEEYIYNLYEELSSCTQPRALSVACNQEASCRNSSILDHNEMCDNCAICYEGLEERAVKVLQCSHKFHVFCLTKWKKRTCPLCRQDYSDQIPSTVTSRYADDIMEEILRAYRPTGPPLFGSRHIELISGQTLLTSVILLHDSISSSEDEPNMIDDIESGQYGNVL